MYFNKESGEGKKDPLTSQIIGCVIEVHRTLGPELLESTYEKRLAHELKLAGIPFINQAAIPIDYKGISLDCGYWMDFLIDDSERAEELQEIRFLSSKLQQPPETEKKRLGGLEPTR